MKLEGRAGANLENAPSQFNLLLRLTGFRSRETREGARPQNFLRREGLCARERALHVGKLKKKDETRFARIIRPLKENARARPSFLIQNLISKGMEMQEAAALALAADKSLSTDRIKWQSFVIKTRQKKDESCVRKQQQPPLLLSHKGSLILIQDKSSIKASERKESADDQGMISSGMAHTNAALIIIVCTLSNYRESAFRISHFIAEKLLSLRRQTLLRVWLDCSWEFKKSQLKRRQERSSSFFNQIKSRL